MRQCDSSRFLDTIYWGIFALGIQINARQRSRFFLARLEPLADPGSGTPRITFDQTPSAPHVGWPIGEVSYGCCKLRTASAASAAAPPHHVHSMAMRRSCGIAAGANASRSASIPAMAAPLAIPVPTPPDITPPPAAPTREVLLSRRGGAASHCAGGPGTVPLFTG